MEKGKLSLKIEELEDRIAPVLPGFGLGTALSVGATPSHWPGETPSGVLPGRGTLTR
jgi:hypothetical protein